MIANGFAAIAICAALMVGGVASFSALGEMSGTCDQIKQQDQLKLQDGTGDNCTCSIDDVEDAAEDTCDACNDYDWDFLYGETDLEAPHQSQCGAQE